MREPLWFKRRATHLHLREVKRIDKTIPYYLTTLETVEV